MSIPKTYADIILPLPVRGFFTYSVPSSIFGLKAGMRVLLPFGKKKIYTGIVYKTHTNKPSEYETKDIISVLDDNIPSVSEHQLKLWNWSANYYMCSIGDFYKASVPTGLRLESETKIILTNIDNKETLTPTERLICDELEINEPLLVSDIARIASVNNPMPIIKNLIRIKAICVQEELRQKYKPQVQKYIQLAKRINSFEKIEKAKITLDRSPKQKEVFEDFLKHVGLDSALDGSVILKKELLPSTSALKGLVTKNILKEVVFEESRLKHSAIKSSVKNSLNEHQQKAFELVKNKFNDKDVVLLHGVTSSGKTEVYIHLIEEFLEKGQQVLYMLPEIAITLQIITRLKSVFGNKVGVYHSKLSDNERFEVYNSMLKNSDSPYKIILGVRSSVFLPFWNLGLIVVDEEHENTYKQFDPSPRYNARDIAVVMSSFYDCKVVLGSATPSLESYFNAKKERYGLVELTTRYKNISLPDIVIANVKKAYQKKQMQANFTPQLMDKIDTALKDNKQVILFQNRRGFSRYLECESCGWVPTCKRCDVSLTYHKSINKLLCHYCGYTTDGFSNCPQCKHLKIETKGFGTEKIEDDISIIFPDAKVARLDIDTTRGKKKHEKIIGEFQNKEIDILIGTQMVSKGLDFESVSVVGIMSADNMLRFPDFRAYERSYQLMAQVSGRAGRSGKQGEVVIQTYDPENMIVKQVQHNSYEEMFTTQLKERDLFFYPPFSRLIKITLKHRNQETVNATAYYLVKDLSNLNNSKTLGPSTPPIFRVRNEYIKTILIKLSKTKKIVDEKKAIQNIIDNLSAHKTHKSVRIIIDVDPM